MNRHTIFTLLFTYVLLHFTFAQEKAAKTIGLGELHIAGKRYEQSAESSISVDHLSSDSMQRFQTRSLKQNLSESFGRGLIFNYTSAIF